MTNNYSITHKKKIIKQHNMHNQTKTTKIIENTKIRNFIFYIFKENKTKKLMEIEIKQEQQRIKF